MTSVSVNDTVVTDSYMSASIQTLTRLSRTASMTTQTKVTDTLTSKSLNDIVIIDSYMSAIDSTLQRLFYVATQSMTIMIGLFCRISSLL